LLISDIGAQKFNFAPEFHPKWGFLAPTVVFLEENFDDLW